MEIDIEDFDALRRYLAERIDSGEPASFQKLLGGVSNRTVRITWPDGSGWVFKQALAKLRVQADWFSNPDRIQVEARALRWLNRIGVPGSTPGFVFEDPENHLIAMEAVPEAHENWKSVLLSGNIASDFFEQFGALLGTIHRQSADCPNSRQAFEDTTYFESLRLEPYYLYTAQRVPEAASFLYSLARETLQHKLSLVHGDFSPKNTLIYGGKLILLDFEAVHFGDPAFDVGFALTHFLSKAHHLREHRTVLRDAAKLFWQTYSQQIALLQWDSLELRAVRHTLGCLLARVAGKSPLEYLTLKEVGRQRDAVLRLMTERPATIDHLIDEFVDRIEVHAENRQASRP